MVPSHIRVLILYSTNIIEAFQQIVSRQMDIVKSTGVITVAKNKWWCTFQYHSRRSEYGEPPHTRTARCTKMQQK